MAYELREPDGRHVLVVLRAEPDQSIKEIRSVLPDFQVHGMRCGSTAVELAGWDATYTFDMALHSPHVSVEALPRPGDLPSWPAENLAQWNGKARSSGAAIVELPWNARYVLKIEIAHAQHDCIKMLNTRLYHVGMTKPVMTLLERKVHVECGE